MRNQLNQNRMISEIRQSPLWGDFGGLGWEWVGNWYLLGGAILLYKRIISWHIPVSMLGAVLVMAMLFHFLDQRATLRPVSYFQWRHLLRRLFRCHRSGNGSNHQKGQLIYGACIGLITYVIRRWGGYPDAVAFAVLLMNMAAPMIDYYTQPRVSASGTRAMIKHPITLAAWCSFCLLSPVWVWWRWFTNRPKPGLLPTNGRHCWIS